MSVTVTIVGAGYMGTAHARVLNRIANEYPDLVEMRYIVDTDLDKAGIVARKYGGKPLHSVDQIPKKEIDLAFIATPTESHYPILKSLLDKDVRGFFIEKPLTRNLQEGIELVKTVEENDLWLNVGHIERFNPAVQALHTRIRNGFVGEVLTTISRRVGPFTLRSRNTDVVYDLGIHEIDNSLAIYRRPPIMVRSFTLENFMSNLTDYALIVLGYDRGFSSIEVNRVTPFKQRTMYLTCSKAVTYLDYINQELRIYMNEHEIVVKIRREEPLYLEDFTVIRAFQSREGPPIDVYQAFTGLFLCEKALESTRCSKEIVLESDEFYKTYNDVIQRGLHNIHKYLDRYLGNSVSL